MRQYGMPVQIIVRARTQDAAIGKIDRLLQLLRRQQDVTGAEFNGAVFDAGGDETAPMAPEVADPNPDPGRTMTMAVRMFVDRNDRPVRRAYEVYDQIDKAVQSYLREACLTDPGRLNRPVSGILRDIAEYYSQVFD